MLMSTLVLFSTQPWLADTVKLESLYHWMLCGRSAQEKNLIRWSTMVFALMLLSGKTSGYCVATPKMVSKYCLLRLVLDKGPTESNMMREKVSCSTRRVSTVQPVEPHQVFPPSTDSLWSFLHVQVTSKRWLMGQLHHFKTVTQDSPLSICRLHSRPTFSKDNAISNKITCWTIPSLPNTGCHLQG